jgi:ribose-phosphate pyrophosphokinase
MNSRKVSDNMYIFSGNANRPLAAAVAAACGMTLSEAQIDHFSDGEIKVRYPQSIRAGDVFIIQPTGKPVSDNLMELLIMIDAAVRASATRVTAVMPYFGYARQDRKDEPRVSITAKLVANLLTTAGVHRLLTLDLHAGQIQGFFDIPVDHLYGAPVLAQYFQRLDQLTVVSPDAGGVQRARAFAKIVDAPLAIVDKRRPRANVAEVMNIIGEVKGRRCVLVDDIIDTAGTIGHAAAALKAAGAIEVYACCSHGVLSGPAAERINASCLTKVVTTDTLHHDNLPDRVERLTVAPLLAEAMLKIHTGDSLSTLFAGGRPTGTR